MGLTGRLLIELGADSERLKRIRTLAELQALKDEAKKRFKALAFKYHPDRNPGDDGLILRVLGETLKWVEGLQLPKPVVRTVTYTYPQTDAPSRPTPRQVYDARRVVLIKPA